ncbi:MAG: hypothetical protein FD143_390 [Ignavibacteria bacterium]|nr:MAG: hypothetical protein FD143_390 [Ignavibacteria bacterium]KAF0160324.1 MAG: hypothetical protein FD188_1826 [Ignavibacteria bacterium]
MRKLFILLIYLIVNIISFSQSPPDSKPNILTKPTRIDSIVIKGNEATKDFIILRELTFQTRDVVDSTLLHFNRERVFSLALFNRVELSVLKISDKNVLVIEVEESWYLYPIPYWYTKNNSIETLTYGIYFLRRNFRGRNETLKANIAFGYDKYFSIQYDNPALFYDNEIGFSALASYYNYTNVNETAKKLNEGDFIYKLIRVSVGFWKRINQFYLVGSKTAFDYWEINTKPKGALTASGTKVDHLPSLSIYQFYDTRDLKLFSQDGIYTFFSFTHKGFGVDGISYNTFEMDLRGYQTIAGELSSKLRLFHRRSFGKQVPYYDYSFLGFSEKIRGHNNIFFDAHNSILTSLELSYPLLNEWNFSIKLPLIPKNLTSARVGIHLNVFADAGTVFNNGEPLILQKFHSGYGAGITLLLLPYNAFRFEYAINERGKGEIVFAAGFSF